MEEPEKQPAPSPVPRHFIRKFFKYFFMLLLLCLIAAAGGIYWATQTQSGLAWVMNTANNFLAADADKPGLRLKLERLQGSLPFNFEFGLTLADAEGIWLTAPANRFVLDWRELPKLIHISTLAIADARMERLPRLPAAEKEEKPGEPFTIKDFQDIMAQVAGFAENRPWWLPDINFENIRLDHAILPPSLIPGEKSQPLQLDLAANLAMSNLAPVFTLGVNIQTEDGQPVHMPALDFNKAALDINLSAAPHAQELEANGGVNLLVAAPKLDIKGLPENFLGQNINLELKLAARANVAEPGLSLELNGPLLDAGQATISGHAQWQSGAAWKKGELDGPFDAAVELNLIPIASGGAVNPALEMLAKPAHLVFSANGDLPRANLKLLADCGKAVAEKHNIENIELSILADSLELPLKNWNPEILEKENDLTLKLGAHFDGQPIKLSTLLFFQAESAAQQPGSTSTIPESWLAGFRDLQLTGFGVRGSGAVTAFIKPALKPALNGNLEISISDWKAIERFMPGKNFAGNVKADVRLINEDRTETAQNAQIALHVQNLAIDDNGQSLVRVREIASSIAAADIFRDIALDVRLGAKGLAAAGLDINADAQAQGPLTGPIQASITTAGSVVAKAAAQWEPGKAELSVIDVKLPGLLKKKGSPTLGIKSNGQAEILYGDSGISVKSLDIDILPSGRLTASGGLAPENLDFKLALNNLDFKPWQALSPQIPAGKAGISASLSGSPKRPSGKFALTLDNVAVPNVPLPPLTMAMNGNIEHGSNGSALNASLKFDPRFLKALGSDKADAAFSFPLKFGADGIPAPDMAGPLSAHILWDGALGPLWNLVPMPDRRLNGRLALDIKAGGTAEKPRVTGAVNIKNGRFEDLGLGILITAINVSLGLAEDSSMRNLENPDAMFHLPGGLSLTASASDGRGGSINIDGKGALSGEHLDIKAKINHLRPLRRRDVHIELSGNASVTGQALAPVINGEIIVNQGEVLLDNLSIPASVVTLPITTPEQLAAMKKKEAAPVQPPVAQTPHDSGSLNVRIIMLPRFTVEGRGLSSTWKANLLIVGSPQQPQMTGSIDAVKGNFDFLGKNFVLSKGIVTFAGGSLSDPLLDIELTNETPDLTANIIVTGAVSNIHFEVTSDPAMPRDEVISHVLFGKSVNDLSRLEALQLAAAVAQLAGLNSGADNILGMAKNALGVDVLRIGTSNTGAAGEPGDQTAGGTTIEMGKYINDNIYMGVQQGMKPDSTAFIIQMELTPRTSLEVRTEQNNTWGGLKWKLNY